MHSPPRPILKSSPSPTATTPLPFPTARAPLCGSLHVHFPPTPTMTQTDLTHSSFSYDRKPIIVLPNACALPGRGERDMDALPEPEFDLDLWALVHRKAKAKGAYFRAYESLEADSVSDSDLADQFSSSLLFTRDSSSSSLSTAYRVQNDTLSDNDNDNDDNDHHYQAPNKLTQSHVRSVQFVGTVDSSDTECSTAGSFYLNASMDACQFIQNIPHMDLSLPFMPRKQPRVRNKVAQVKEKEGVFTPKKRSTTTATTTATTPTPTPTPTRSSTANHFERTRKAVYNASCGGFGSGLYESGLDGCLGGF